MGILLVILLIILLVPSAPVWPHSATWGYGPSSMLGLVLLVVLILLLLGKI